MHFWIDFYLDLCNDTAVGFKPKPHITVQMREQVFVFQLCMIYCISSLSKRYIISKQLVANSVFPFSQIDFSIFKSFVLAENAFKIDGQS